MEEWFNSKNTYPHLRVALWPVLSGILEDFDKDSEIVDFYNALYKEEGDLNALLSSLFQDLVLGAGRICIPLLCKVGGGVGGLPFRILRKNEGVDLPGSDFASQLKLVGTGFSKDSCGRVGRVGACEELHDKSLTSSHIYCSDRTCPVCFGVYVHRQAQGVTDRLTAFFEISERIRQDEPDFPHPGPLNHWKFSPSPVWSLERVQTVEGFRYMRDILRGLLKRAGVRGAVIVPHLYRATKLAKSKFAQARKGKDETAKFGIWRYLRRNEFLDSKHLYLSPHFHILGYGFLQNSKVFSCETAGFKCGLERCDLAACPHFKNDKERELGIEGKGWVYKKIRPVAGDLAGGPSVTPSEIYKELETKGCKIDGSNEFKRTVFEVETRRLVNYLLDHTAVLGEKNENGKFPVQSVTWFGEVYFKNLKHEARKEKEPMLCPDCCEPVYEYDDWENVLSCDEHGDLVWTWRWVEEVVTPRPRIERPLPQVYHGNLSQREDTPIPTNFPLYDYIEYHDFWLKSHPQEKYKVTMFRVTDPPDQVRKKGRPPDPEPVPDLKPGVAWDPSNPKHIPWCFREQYGFSDYRGDSKRNDRGPPSDE